MLYYIKAKPIIQFNKSNSVETIPTQNRYVKLIARNNYNSLSICTGWFVFTFNGLQILCSKCIF